MGLTSVNGQTGNIDAQTLANELSPFLGGGGGVNPVAETDGVDFTVPVGTQVVIANNTTGTAHTITLPPPSVRNPPLSIFSPILTGLNPDDLPATAGHITGPPGSDDPREGRSPWATTGDWYLYDTGNRSIFISDDVYWYQF